MFRKSGYVSASKCVWLSWAQLQASKLPIGNSVVEVTTASLDRSFSTARSKAFMCMAPQHRKVISATFDLCGPEA